MSPELTQSLAGVLAPALTADSSHAQAVSSTSSEATRQIAEADATTAAQQQQTITAADDAAVGLQSRWSTEKEGIATEHRTAISTEAARTRAEATQTMNDAEAKARAESEKAPAAEGATTGTGFWNQVKSVGAAAAAAASNMASSVVAGVTAIVTAARTKVNGLLDRFLTVVRDRVAAARRAIAEGARKVAGAITAAVRRAKEVVTRLAAAVAQVATRIWKAAADKLAALWQKLKATAAAALSAARSLASKVAGALGTVKQILALLGNKMLGFVADLVSDPQGKIVAPFVAKAAPLAAGVPAKAGELAKQSAGEASAVHGNNGPTVQRQEAGQAPAGETFWSGVWRHLQASGANFLDNWAPILGKIVLDVLLWVPMLVEEVPKLWTEVKGVFTGGGGVDRLDHALGVLRHVVNIVGGTLATVGVWALIIAWLGGPVAEGFVLAGFEALSIGVIVADLGLATAEMAKYAYSATRPGISTSTREQYLGMFTGSGIAAAITVVLVALGALAARLAKSFKLRRIAAAEAAEGKKLDPARKGGPVEEKPPATAEPPTPVDDPGGAKLKTGAAKGLDATPETIRDGSVRMEDHPSYPAAVEDLKAKGFTLVDTAGDPHVTIRRVVDAEGAIVRTEMQVHVQKGMRYLDFEHEVGHVNQMMDKARFPDGPPPTDIVIEKPGGTTAARDQSGVLTMWQDAIVEYHNRLQEVISLSERGASPSIVKEHLDGLDAHYARYRDKGLMGGRSPSRGKWADEHFPDIADLRRKVQQISTEMSAPAGQTPTSTGG